MVELLEAVWAAGIDTSYSCQGGHPHLHTGQPSQAIIVFPSAYDALRFMHHALVCSTWGDGLSMELAEPVYDSARRRFGPVRAAVRWAPDLTGHFTDVWCGRLPDDDPRTRHMIDGDLWPDLDDDLRDAIRR